MYKHIGADITAERNEACHCLNKQNDITIVKLLRRKDCEHVMRKKSELRELRLWGKALTK